MDLSWINRSREEIETAVTAGLVRKKQTLEEVYAIADDKRTFANTVGALEHASDALTDLQQQLDLMVMVHPDKKIRDAAQENLERIESANIEFESDRRLWSAVMAWQKTGEQLDPIDGKLTADIIRDLKRVGFGLAEKEFSQLKAVRRELQKLEQEFERVINEYGDHIEVSRDRLGGLPERFIEGLHRTADDKYEVALQYPEFFPFMESADDDAARRELAVKDLRKGGQANLDRLARMIALRQQEAGLLGYSSYADYVQEVYMAGKAVTVDGFLSDIIRKLEPKVHGELRELIDIKKRTLDLDKPAPVHFHEIAYWSQKLKAEKFDFDPELIREYFPLEKVLDRMFRLYQDVLGLVFERQKMQLWHPDAQFYSMKDARTGRLYGYFALDLYPREGKYGHAATFPVAIGRQDADGNQVPGFFALVCNYPRPTDSNPSLLTPENEGVETLLHEFGHVVHALVSGGRWQRQNGFGTPLDFVEMPSQAFEYWLWDPRILIGLSCHHLTGETLPKELADKFVASRQHQQASYHMAVAVRALFDLRIHSQPVSSPAKADLLAQEYRDMKLEYESIELPPDSLFPAGWGHMSDYAAGYYSYLWSKVYAADIFTRFIPDPADATVGYDYRAKVLEPGASRPERGLVEDFLGRPANADALMAELGV